MPDAMSPREMHILTREEILAAPLHQFDASGVRLSELSHGNAVALLKAADDKALNDRAFSAGVIARQVVEPATTPGEVASWGDERLLAVLAEFLAHDKYLTLPEGKAITFAAFRAAARAKADAQWAEVRAMLSPIADSQLRGVSESIRALMKSQADLDAFLGSTSALQRTIDSIKQSGEMVSGGAIAEAARRTSSPFAAAMPEARFDSAYALSNYEAETAGAVERLAHLSEAGIKVAQDQQDELVTLNASVGVLTGQQGETNQELRKLRDSTPPRWVAYLILMVAVLTLIVAVLVGLWSIGAHDAAAPAPTPAPIVTPVTSPSP